jgi:hypothetical protein
MLTAYSSAARYHSLRLLLATNLNHLTERIVKAIVMLRYDTAQICCKGHMINDAVKRYPEFSKDYCPDCGEPTITACPNCENPIQGVLEDSLSLKQPEPPKFCKYCGQPFPWTEQAISAAMELAEEFDTLDDDDKKELKKNIDDVLKDTPRTDVAVMKLKKLFLKAGDEAPPMFKAALINIVTQAAMHKLGWG